MKSGQIRQNITNSYNKVTVCVFIESGISLALTRIRIILLPPLPEQRAIATALSDVDALIAALEAMLTKKRQIKA